MIVDGFVSFVIDTARIRQTHISVAEEAYIRAGSFFSM
jgi:hypothetical protein